MHDDVSTIEAQLKALPAPDAEDVARVRASCREHAIPYALGSGEAELVALYAGLKPVVRQALDPAKRADARARFERRGLHVVERSARAGRPALLFAGHDPDRVRATAECESAAAQRHGRELGRLLGYPACCVEAFLETPEPRSSLALARAAWARTQTVPRPRLNTLDLGVFHYLAWAPCAFDCELSARYADAVADCIRHRYGQALQHGMGATRRCPPGCRHERFVRDVDRALGAHRLIVTEGVQLSLTGEVVGGVIHLERVWATARDRHPRVPRPAAELSLATRLCLLLESASTVKLDDGVLLVDAKPRLRADAMLLVPFGVG